MSGEGHSPSPQPPDRAPEAPAPPLTPTLAPVTPRAALPGGAPLPLHDQVRRLLRSEPRAHVTLVGPRGAGKTAALRHLAATLPPDTPVILVEDDGSHRVGGGGCRKDRLLLTVARQMPIDRDQLVLGLAPW